MVLPVETQGFNVAQKVNALTARCGSDSETVQHRRHHIIGRCQRVHGHVLAQAAVQGVVASTAGEGVISPTALNAVSTFMGVDGISAKTAHNLIGTGPSRSTALVIDLVIEITDSVPTEFTIQQGVANHHAIGPIFPLCHLLFIGQTPIGLVFAGKVSGEFKYIAHQNIGAYGEHWVVLCVVQR